MKKRSFLALGMFTGKLGYWSVVMVLAALSSAVGVFLYYKKFTANIPEDTITTSTITADTIPSGEDVLNPFKIYSRVDGKDFILVINYQSSGLNSPCSSELDYLFKKDNNNGISLASSEWPGFQVDGINFGSSPTQNCKASIEYINCETFRIKVTQQTDTPPDYLRLGDNNGKSYKITLTGSKDEAQPFKAKFFSPKP